MLRAIARHKLLFAGVAVLVTSLAVFATALLPTRYTALASVVVSPLLPDPLGTGAREDTALRDDEVATQAAMMGSRDLAAAVAARFPVGAAPGFADHARLQLCAWFAPGAAPPGLCAPPRPRTADHRAAEFMQRLRAVPVPRTRIIELAYTDADPALAAEALDALVELFQQRQIATRAADLARTSGWISDRSEALRRTWLAAEAAAGQFRTANGLAPSGARDTAPPLATQQVASAAASLSRAEEELATARARAAALRAARAAPDRLALVPMRDEPGLVALGTQLSALLAQQADMQNQFSPAFPGHASLRNQVAAVQAQIAGEIRRALAAIETDVQVRQAQVENLSATLAALRRNAGSLNAQQVQLSTLEDEARSARTVFETFLARARQLDDRAGLLQPQVQFAAHATMPDLPSFPARGRLWLGGAVLGLALGFAAVSGREALARGFRNVSRVGGQLSLPFLGAIPAVDAPLAHRLLGPRKDRHLARHMLDQPFSAASEAVRSILNQFELQSTADQPVRSVVVASATGQEGKTTTAIWLASAAARGGSRVLLIDADGRRGTVAERLGAANDGPGFGEMVFGTTPLDAVLRHDADAGFDYVPAGRPVARPFDRADVVRLRDLLAGLTAEYDLVVIDTAPMLAMTDPFIYARQADATLFICRWSRTSRGAVASCLGRLRATGARIAGVALSRVDGDRLAHFSDDLTRRDMRVIKRYYVG